MSLNEIDRAGIPTIVWDMDDTLCHLTPVLINVVFKATGKLLTDDDLARGHWVQHHVPPELVNQVEAAIFAPHIYRGLKPSVILHDLVGPKGAQLRQQFRHHVITARGGALGNVAMPISHAWLSDWHMKLDGLSITHPDDNKMDYAPRSVLAVVDDSARVIQHALADGCYGILVDHPWNRKFLSSHKNFRRVAPENLVSFLTELLVPQL